MAKASVSDEALDLTSLSYAVLVSENGSFRLASEMLGVKTSVVSRRLRGLEDALGVSLFHRTRRDHHAELLPV